MLLKLTHRQYAGAPRMIRHRRRWKQETESDGTGGVKERNRWGQQWMGDQVREQICVLLWPRPALLWRRRASLLVDGALPFPLLGVGSSRYLHPEGPKACGSSRTFVLFSLKDQKHVALRVERSSKILICLYPRAWKNSVCCLVWRVVNSWFPLTLSLAKGVLVCKPGHTWRNGWVPNGFWKHAREWNEVLQTTKEVMLSALLIALFCLTRMYVQQPPICFGDWDCWCMHTGAREKVIQKRILLRADEGGCMVVALGARDSAWQTSQKISFQVLLPRGARHRTWPQRLEVEP
jgi:hypothetical protein